MAHSEIYNENKSKVLSVKDFNEKKLWGAELLSEKYDKDVSYKICLPETEEEPMTISYESFNKNSKERYAAWEPLDLGDHSANVYNYDFSKSLEWNLGEAEDWVRDCLDEFLDMAAYEKLGPEKYYGCPPLM